MIAEVIQLLPDPNSFSSIGWVFVVIVCIIAGVRQIMGLLRDMKDKPAPSEVQREAASLFVLKSDFAAHLANFAAHIAQSEMAHTTLREELKVDRHETRNLAQSATFGLSHEVQEVGKKVAGLETATEFQNQTLMSVTSDIKQILGRLPRNGSSE